MKPAAVDVTTAVGLAIVEGDAGAVRELNTAGGLKPFHAEIIAAAVDLADTGRKITPRGILDAIGDSSTFDHVQWSRLTTAGTDGLDAWTARAAVKAYLEHRDRHADAEALRLALEQIEAGGTRTDYLSAVRERLETIDTAAADPFLLEPWDLDPLTAPVELVAGLIEKGTTVGIVGPTGAGKTFFGQDVGACIATGRPFHGRSVTRAKVANFNGEGRTGAIRRYHGWSRYHGVEIPSDYLTVSKSAARITEPGFIPVVNRVLERTGAEVIIVDTLNRNAGVPFNENSTEDMTGFISNLDRLRERHGLTIIIVHHTGHGAADRARGSSVFRASLDAEFIVSKADDGTISVIQSKAKDTEPAPPMAFRLVQVPLTELHRADGSTVTTAVLEPTDPPKKHTDRLGKNQKLALAHLADLWREARENVAASGRKESEAAVTAETWEERAKGKSRKADGKHVPFPRWSEVLQSLTDAELIRFDGPIVHILTADSPSSWSGPPVRPGVFTDTPDRTDHGTGSGKVRNSPNRTKSDQTDQGEPADTMSPEQRQWFDEHKDEVF